MKIIFKKILQYYLKYITKLALAVHRPIIVAIAGSTNKTFVKEEIAGALKNSGINTGSDPKSFNTEIGLPLAILGLPSGYNSYKNWLPAILKAPFSVLRPDWPRVFVLEFGVSNRGDMKDLLSIAEPKVAVITEISQRYLESFNDMDELAEEYECLVKKISKNGLVVLNNDNLRVISMAGAAKTKVISFGFGNGADWQAIKTKGENNGQTVEIKHGNEMNRHEIKRFGEHHIYALLVGIIVKQYIKGLLPNEKK